MPHRLAPAQRFNGLNLIHSLLTPFSSSQSWSSAARLCTAILLAQSTLSLASDSSKRGLVDITTLANAVQDDAVLTEAGSDITWYYNYGPTASSSLASNKDVEFVPMLWGSASSGNFMATVESQMKGGANITSILSFNEPDNCGNTGGSCIQPATAAQIWQSQLEPLQKQYGLKVGQPAVTSSQQGLDWLAAWYTACDGGCSPDFLSLHYYGDFDGMASWIGQMNASYLNNVTDGIWVTEFAYADQPLNDTQAYYNQTIEYLDNLSYIKRYSYFGAFRSDVSNVGPNVAMFNSSGALTAIGNAYMGGNFTGAIPNAVSASSSPSSTPKSGAAGLHVATGMVVSAAVLAGVLLI